MTNIISQAKNAVTPSKETKNSIRKVADQTVELVKIQAAKYDQIIDVELGGSYAKGTWIAEYVDVDIFVKFKRSTPDETFSEISRKIGFDALDGFEPYVRYSAHPYVEAKIDGVLINIVPCYDVKRGRWKSAADRSPHHTTHIKDTLNYIKKREVRLLKTFLRSAGIYGAEIARQGFSGYVSEVLILEFQSFKNVINAMADLEENAVIGKPRKKFKTPLVIVDPIDSKRNLAAAISVENIGKFILRCRAFQKEPSMQFFSIPRQKENIELDNVLIVEFEFSSRSPEIIWGQIKRAASSLATQLDVEGFNVLRSGSYTDEKSKAWLFFVLESIEIPDICANAGPNFFMRRYADKFIAKNVKKSKLMWVSKDKKIISLEKREFNNAKDYLECLIDGKQRAGLPKGLREDFKEGFQVFAGTSKVDKSVEDAICSLVSTDDAFFHFN